jgi:UDP-N-acetyl-D-mannosaminuronic acid dehydrogenase
MDGNSFDVGVVGLGYVGLTLATALADVGLNVLGIERREEVVDQVRAGKPHFSEVGLSRVLETVVANGAFVARSSFEPGDTCAAHIITVGTPLGPDGIARLDMIENATAEVAKSMPDGALVILRSTVKIGTARHVVAPILERSGKSFDLAMCPERTLEGSAMKELRHLPQIIGADSARAANRAAELFSRLTAQVLTVSSLETAEIIKLADNTFRDVRFAFANEVARLCDAVGVSAHEVVATGKLGYPRTNIAQPGLVGGPCLEKDPHILRQSASAYGLDLEITGAARLVNERQPQESVRFIAKELERRGVGHAAKFAVLGLAFKGVPETDDLRGAMSVRVIQEIRAAYPGAEISVFDPVVHRRNIEALGLELVTFDDPLDAMAGADVAVIANNHPSFAALSLSSISDALAPHGFMYDFWNHFSDFDASRTLDYFALGNTRRRPQ